VLADPQLCGQVTKVAQEMHQPGLGSALQHAFSTLMIEGGPRTFLVATYIVELSLITSGPCRGADRYAGPEENSSHSG
jgi:hypothetical protein